MWLIIRYFLHLPYNPAKALWPSVNEGKARSEIVQMNTHTIGDIQKDATRLAGIMYLLTMLTANLADFYVRRPLFAAADPTQTFKNMAASGMLVRLGIGADLITITGSAVLAVALYFLFKPIHRTGALIAVFWSLLECSVAAIVTLNTLAVLFFLSDKDSLQALNSSQLGTQAQLFLSVDRAANRIAAVLFGLGSILFCYLWFKSRYVPRILVVWGILGSLVPIIAPLLTVMFPSFIDVPLRRARSGWPIMTFEVLLGLWLLVKGTRSPIGE